MTKSFRERKKEKKYLGRLNSLDDQAKDTALRCREYTLLNPEKLYAFIQAIRYIEKNGISGDIVECGVWRGGAIMAAALTLKQLNMPERTFYLYDTFAGMSRPTDKDRPVPGTGDFDVNEAFERAKTGHDSSDWCYASLEDVKQNLSGIDYDQSKFVYVEGKVEDTLPAVLPGPISILRLDTDWYDSTRQEMEHLLPLLVPKGVLIIDDYYRWAGNKDAVDEYLEEHRIPILLTRVGNSAIGVLPC
ncbi:MAG: TylF/MycF/NovP-related O-methyltransferase [Gammaproteobacteria bacterium]